MINLTPTQVPLLESTGLVYVVPLSEQPPECANPKVYCLNKGSVDFACKPDPYLTTIPLTHPVGSVVECRAIVMRDTGGQDQNGGWIEEPEEVALRPTVTALRVCQVQEVTNSEACGTGITVLAGGLTERQFADYFNSLYASPRLTADGKGYECWAWDWWSWEWAYNKNHKRLGCTSTWKGLPLNVYHSGNCWVQVMTLRTDTDTERS